MEQLKFSIHPLFFVVGFCYALSNKFLTFLIYTITAILHEGGHSIISSRLGYSLKKVTLMPFGAIVSGEKSILSPKEEIQIAIAGPIANIVVGLFFVSLWWIFPPIYCYTDVIVLANFSLAIINLFPFFPLDGGRILIAILSMNFDRKKSVKIAKVIGFLGGLMLLSLFIISILYNVNYSLLLFSLFIIVGSISIKYDNRYVKNIPCTSSKIPKRGLPYKKIAIDGNEKVKTLLNLFDEKYLLEVVVFFNGEAIKTLSPFDLEKIVKDADYNSKIITNI